MARRRGGAERGYIPLRGRSTSPGHRTGRSVVGEHEAASRKVGTRPRVARTSLVMGVGRVGLVIGLVEDWATWAASRDEEDEEGEFVLRSFKGRAAACDELTGLLNACLSSSPMCGQTALVSQENSERGEGEVVDKKCKGIGAGDQKRMRVDLESYGCLQLVNRRRAGSREREEGAL